MSTPSTAQVNEWAQPSTYPSRHLLHDETSRRRRAAKILAILRQALGQELEQCRVLDIGCSSGRITRHLAPSFGATLGLERDAGSLRLVGADLPSRLAFVLGDAMSLPVQDGSLDIVICAQVYEHVPDADRLAGEVWRVLRSGGTCCFSGPNKLDPIERHYGLPFLAWIPRNWASAILRRRGLDEEYDIQPRTYWALRRMWRRFTIHDATVAMIRNPEQYACVEELGPLHWVGRLPVWLLRLMAPFFPNYNWVLVKRG